MVLPSRGAAAAPAYALPSPLAFCSISAKPEACTPPAAAASADATATDKNVRECFIFSPMNGNLPGPGTGEIYITPRRKAALKAEMKSMQEQRLTVARLQHAGGGSRRRRHR